MIIKIFASFLIRALTILSIIIGGCGCDPGSGATTKKPEKPLSKIIKAENIGTITIDKDGEPLKNEIKKELKKKYPVLDTNKVVILRGLDNIPLIIDGKLLNEPKHTVEVCHSDYAGDVTLTYTPKKDEQACNSTSASIEKPVKKDLKDLIEPSSDCTHFLTEDDVSETSLKDLLDLDADIDVDTSKIKIDINRNTQEITISPLDNYYTGSVTFTYYTLNP